MYVTWNAIQSKGSCFLDGQGTSTDRLDGSMKHTNTHACTHAPFEDDVQEGRAALGLVLLVAGGSAHEAHAEASLWVCVC